MWGQRGSAASGVSTGDVNAKIVFDNDKVNADNVDGLSVSEREVKITKPGMYTFSGTWNDGQYWSILARNLKLFWYSMGKHYKYKICPNIRKEC